MNNLYIPFSIPIIYDGYSTTITINLSTFPVTNNYNAIIGSQYLTAVIGIADGDYSPELESTIPITSFGVSGGIATFEMSAPGTAGTTDILGGFFIY